MEGGLGRSLKTKAAAHLGCIPQEGNKLSHDQDLELQVRKSNTQCDDMKGKPSPIVMEDAICEWPNNMDYVDFLPPSCNGSQHRKCHHPDSSAAAADGSPLLISSCGGRALPPTPSPNAVPLSPVTTPANLSWTTYCPHCQLSMDTLDNITCDNCSSSTFSADVLGSVPGIDQSSREDSTTLSLSDPNQDQESSSTDISCYANKAPQHYAWTGQENGNAVTMAACSLMVTMENGNGPVHTHAHHREDKVLYARPKEMVVASVLLMVPAPPCGLAALYFAIRAYRCHKNGQFEEVRKFNRGVMYCCGMGLVFFIALVVALLVRFHITYSNVPAGFYNMNENGLWGGNETWTSNMVNQTDQQSNIQDSKPVILSIDPQQLFKPALGIPSNLTAGDKIDDLIRQWRLHSENLNAS